MQNLLSNINSNKIRKGKNIKAVVLAAVAVTAVGTLASGNIMSYLATLNNFDSAKAASNATLSFGSISTAVVGEQIAVPIQLNTNGNIAGADLKIQFDNSKLRLNDISTPQGGALKAFLPQDSQNNPQKSTVVQNANTSGLIKYSLLAFDPITNKVLATGSMSNSVISTLSFTSLNSGKSQLSFLFSANQTTDTNVSDLNEPRDILQQPQGLEVTINPILASASPSATPIASASSRPTSSPAPSPSRQASPSVSTRPSVAASPTPRPTIIVTKSPTPTPSNAKSPSPVPSTSADTSTNHGLRFDGVNDIVTSAQSIPVMDRFTAEVILSPLTNNSTGLVLVASDDNNGWSIELIRGRAIFWMANKQGTWSSLTHPAVMSRNSWNHIAVTYDNGLAKLYVNGKLENRSKQFSSGYNAGPNFQIGGLRKYPYLNGIIDSVRISNNLVYQDNFSTPTFMSPIPNSSILLYQFNESVGQSISNSVNQNQYNANLGNSDKTEGTDPTWVKIQR